MLDPIADISIFVSVVGALALALVLAVLVGRRAWVERHGAAQQTRVKDIIRELLARIGGDAGEDAGPVSGSRIEKLEAVVGLYQLVRGRDREYLEEFVVAERLLDATIRTA